MRLLMEKQIVVQKVGKDRYGTTMAWIVVDGDIINYKMIEAGMAWWHKYYCLYE